jgi:CHRD domain/PEP-CTERM motif
MRTLIVALVLAVAAAAGPSRAAVFLFTASLDGATEVPPTGSPGVGSATFTFDDALHTMLVQMDFSDLIGTTSAAHVHAPTAVAGAGNTMVATELPLFTGFPVGVHAGTYSHSFDMTLLSSYNPAFVAGPGGGTTAGAEAALIQAALDGKAYVNIHSTFSPGGEIRGFLTSVPEPSSWALMIAGFGLAGGMLRRRQRTNLPAT